VSLAQDRAACVRALPLVSRTFALSIEALPQELREPVRVAYLLCRIVDTIEDEPLVPPSERTLRFDCFERLLMDDHADPRELELLFRSADPDDPEAALCSQAGAVFRCFRALPEPSRQAIRPHVLDMSLGMRMYTSRAAARGRLELRDMPDLSRYCYYVAGTVGELLTDLFAQAQPDLPAEALQQAQQLAADFGQGLQLVNILKDVAGDLERGVVFVPTSLLERHELEPTQLLEPSRREAGLAVLGELTRQARHSLERAKTYVRQWPLPHGEPIRLFCAVPLLLALATLEEIEAGDDTLRPGRSPKISRALLGGLLQRAVQAAGDDRALVALLDAPSSVIHAEPSAPPALVNGRQRDAG
jgi:farnesyl-diphosphate farnesyltransferase